MIIITKMFFETLKKFKGEKNEKNKN